MVAACFTTTTKVPLAVSVEEMWPAFKNAVNIISQHCPQFIQSCELLQGDGGLGTIRLVKFGPASGLVTYAKEELVEVNEEKMVLTYLLLEGDLKKQFKVFKPSISLEKVVASMKSHKQEDILESQYESVAIWKLEYELEEGMPPPQIELLNEGAKMFFKMLEGIIKALQTSVKINPSPLLPTKEEPLTPLPLEIPSKSPSSPLPIKEEPLVPLVV